MAGGAASLRPPSLNPNWAKLQLKLKAGSPRPAVPDAGAAGRQYCVLGKRKERSGPDLAPTLWVPPLSTEILKPTSTDRGLTDALAMDCEMVGVGSQGNKSALGRITLVNAWGNVVYDEYVRPLERVVDFRTRISGIRPNNLCKAKDLKTAQKEVAELIKGRILVGHSLHNDLRALLFSHPKRDIRDTSEYQPFLSLEGRRRALKDLALQILGIKIQQRTHCPVEDARAAMLIYQKHKSKWEKDLKRHLKYKKLLKDCRRRNKRREATTNLVERESVISECTLEKGFEVSSS